MHEGTKFHQKDRGRWSLVSLPNGVSGWVENKDLGGSKLQDADPVPEPNRQMFRYRPRFRGYLLEQFPYSRMCIVVKKEPDVYKGTY